jgi:hypothetical protein
MFKNIPGNNEHEISIEGEVRRRDGSECTLTIAEGRVSIELYKTLRSVNVGWLRLMAHFEVFLPAENFQQMFSVTFVDVKINRWFKLGAVMVFKRPIIIEQCYRIIPGFTDYAITSSGQILEIYKRRVISPLKQGEKDYPEVHIYDPEASRYRDVKIHRLVALAWIPNKDFSLRYIVNHKDGNKRNYLAKNLEWVTYSQNSDHAYKNHLRTDNLKCRVRDCDTGVITSFISKTKACEFMGTTNVRLKKLRYLNGPKLFNGRYELKLESDETPWFYLTGDEVVPLRGPMVRPVQAYRVKDGVVIEGPHVRGLALIIGREKTSVREALAMGPTCVSQGYAYRYKSDEPWNKNFIFYKNRSVCLLATHSETGETKNFKSLRQASKAFKVDRDLIKMRLENNVPHNGWIFKEI